MYTVQCINESQNMRFTLIFNHTKKNLFFIPICFYRCKTLLFNILITHGGLEVMLEALETLGPFSEEMFSHTVLSLRLLAERVNVVSAIDIQAAPLKREDGSNRSGH